MLQDKRSLARYIDQAKALLSTLPPFWKRE